MNNSAEQKKCRDGFQKQKLNLQDDCAIKRKYFTKKRDDMKLFLFSLDV